MKGHAKTIGIATVAAVLAVCGTLLAVGQWKGGTDSRIEAHGRQIADNTSAVKEMTKTFSAAVKAHEVDCDADHARIWQQIGRNWKVISDQYTSVQRELGGLSTQIERLTKQLEE